MEITAPSGKKITLASGGSLVFADTLEAGFYTYKDRQREGEFAVNLLDEAESNIVAAIEHRCDRRPKTDTAAWVERGWSLWPILLGAVLLLLAAEILLAYRQGLSLSPMLMRAGALAALALALVNPRWFQPTAALDVIFGVDLSRSVGQEGQEKAREVLEFAAGLKKAATRTGLMTFGARTGVGVSAARRDSAGGVFDPPGPRANRYPGRPARRGGANRRRAAGKNVAVLRRQREPRQERPGDAAPAQSRRAGMDAAGGLIARPQRDLSEPIWSCRAKSTAPRASKFAARSKVCAKRRRGCACCATAFFPPSGNCG